MVDNTQENELKLLRMQLEELKKEREAEQKVKQASENKETEIKQDPPVDNGSPISSTAAIDVPDDLIVQFKDLLESIDNDIKDAKPTTLLVVFALGVLVGRL